LFFQIKYAFLAEGRAFEARKQFKRIIKFVRFKRRPEKIKGAGTGLTLFISQNDGVQHEFGACNHLKPSA
jgi:hypothetical protein